MNSRRSRIAKTIIFWPWWQPFDSFYFETLSFLPSSPFFLFATQTGGRGGGGGTWSPSVAGVAGPVNTMIDNIENKIENLRLQECSLRNRSFWKLVISLETETVTSGLCYIEDLIFLDISCLWNSVDVQSTDNSVELYNILSYSMFFFNNFLHQFLEKNA